MTIKQQIKKVEEKLGFKFLMLIDREYIFKPVGATHVEALTAAQIRRISAS